MEEKRRIRKIVRYSKRGGVQAKSAIEEEFEVLDLILRCEIGDLVHSIIR